MASWSSIAALFGLLAAASWGTGDFCGGLATKRSPGYSVVTATEFVGAFLLIALALITGEAWPDGRSIWFSIAAGLAGLLGLGSLYQGLAVGRMGVIAPLSALIGAVIPVAVGLFTAGWPDRMTLIGFAVALLAVWLLAGTGDFRPTRRDLILAGLAGIGFGFYYVLVAYAGEGGLYWTLTIARFAAGIAFLLFLLATRRPLLPKRSAWGLVGVSGMADVGGNIFYLLATQFGRMDVAAVLSSLFPGMTVLLARVFLDERLTRLQIVGVAAALIAVTLIAG
ncbi:MAG: DMT family transporter [Caldilineaceae bacterium]|nr:DMT family transporter [Caldilineaceae bacterium]